MIVELQMRGDDTIVVPTSIDRALLLAPGDSPGEASVWLDCGGEPNHYLGTIGIGAQLKLFKHQGGRPDNPDNRGELIATLEVVPGPKRKQEGDDS